MLCCSHLPIYYFVQVQNELVKNKIKIKDLKKHLTKNYLADIKIEILKLFFD